MEEKKRYWLKLNKDFLKSPHIKIIKDMPNGKDYVIFYLALMLESVETIGHLRFSDLVPYNEQMLASLTETNVDIVRSAVKIFESLGLMEKFDDGTIYLNQVAQMTGKESDSAERVRQFRLRQEQKALPCNTDVTICNDNKEEEKDKEEEEEDKSPKNNVKKIAKLMGLAPTKGLDRYLNELYPQYFFKEVTIQYVQWCEEKKKGPSIRQWMNWVKKDIKDNKLTLKSDLGIEGI